MSSTSSSKRRHVEGNLITFQHIKERICDLNKLGPASRLRLLNFISHYKAFYREGKPLIIECLETLYQGILSHCSYTNASAPLAHCPPEQQPLLQDLRRLLVVVGAHRLEFERSISHDPEELTIGTQLLERFKTLCSNAGIDWERLLIPAHLMEYLHRLSVDPVQIKLSPPTRSSSHSTSTLPTAPSSSTVRSSSSPSLGAGKHHPNPPQPNDSAGIPLSSHDTVPSNVPSNLSHTSLNAPSDTVPLSMLDQAREGTPEAATSPEAITAPPASQSSSTGTEEPDIFELDLAEYEQKAAEERALSEQKAAEERALSKDKTAKERAVSQAHALPLEPPSRQDEEIAPVEVPPAPSSTKESLDHTQATVSTKDVLRPSPQPSALQAQQLTRSDLQELVIGVLTSTAERSLFSRDIVGRIIEIHPHYQSAERELWLRRDVSRILSKYDKIFKRLPQPSGPGRWCLRAEYLEQGTRKRDEEQLSTDAPSTSQPKLSIRIPSRLSDQSIEASNPPSISPSDNAPVQCPSSPDTELLSDVSDLSSHSDMDLNDEEKSVAQSPFESPFGPQATLVSVQRGRPAATTFDISIKLSVSQQEALKNWYNASSDLEDSDIPDLLLSLSFACYKADAVDSLLDSSPDSPLKWWHRAQPASVQDSELHPFSMSLHNRRFAFPFLWTPENINNFMDLTPWLTVSPYVLSCVQTSGLSQYLFAVIVHPPTQAQLEDLERRRAARRPPLEWTAPFSIRQPNLDSILRASFDPVNCNRPNRFLEDLLSMTM